MFDEVHNVRYLFDETMEKVYHKSIANMKQHLSDYMYESLVFEHSRPGEVDLRRNCKITYKNLGLTLLQCPEFEYEHSFQLYRDLFPDLKGSVVFDCGACCGLDAILFTREGAKHVYCLEPDSKNFENLHLNTQGYPITCIQKALFNNDGHVEFSSENSQGSMVLGKTIDIPIEQLKSVRKCESIKVECVTLDTMVLKYGMPDIVKIDIEGAEYDLVDSMNSVLEHGVPVLFEIHQRVQKIEHYDRLVKYIESFGYTVTLHPNELLGDHILCVAPSRQKSDASPVEQSP